MTAFLSIITIVVGVLLSIAILLQNSKGGGLAAGLGALGNSTQMFGVRRASDALSKATVVLASVFFLLCVVIEILVISTKSDSDGESILQKSATEQPLSPENSGGTSAPLTLPENK